MHEENGILKTLRRFHEESGMDERIDLRALQAVGIVSDGRRTLRVWFNDGRVRDWDCRELIAEGKGRFAQLSNADVFIKAVTVWDGAPGFDLVGMHAEADCIDFDPYEVWVEATDVTESVLSEERAATDEGVRSLFAAEDVPLYGK